MSDSGHNGRMGRINPIIQQEYIDCLRHAQIGSDDSECMGIDSAAGN